MFSGSLKIGLRALLCSASLLAALALVSPAGATCYADTCDDDPVADVEPEFGGSVPVGIPHTGAVDMDWVSFNAAGEPNGVGLGGWSTSTHVLVTWNGYFLMNAPSREQSSYMPHSGRRFTVSLPVYPFEGNVCVHALDYLGGPAGRQLGCVSKFTWWL